MIDRHTLAALDTIDFFASLAETAHLVRNKTARNQSLPLYVIGGFLGAGKTTLLERILSENHGKKLLAIVNDVAALNFDAEMVKQTGADTIALSNGCVCCSQAGGLASSLLDIDKTHPEGLYDGVLIETTGLADVWSVAHVLETIPGYSRPYIISVVDVAARESTLSRTLMERQNGPADLVLLNKCDLASIEEIESTRKKIASCARDARMLETQFSAISLDVFNQETTSRNLKVNNHPAIKNLNVHTHSLISKVSLTSVEIDSLLSPVLNNLLRCKGTVTDVDGEKTFQYTTSDTSLTWSKELESNSNNHISSMVLIFSAEKQKTIDILVDKFKSMGYKDVVSEH